MSVVWPCIVICSPMTPITLAQWVTASNTSKEGNAMANDYNSYLQQIAEMRLHRAQQEHSERVQNTISDYQNAQKERDEAAARQDWESFELADRDCEQLEKDWAYLNPQQQPQQDP